MLLLEQFHNLTLNPTNAAILKELVLQLAVQGKLTEAWRKENPDVEPASELLKRIELEKEQLVKAKKIKKDKELEPVIEDETPFTLPEGWIWCRFQDIQLEAQAGLERSKDLQSQTFMYGYFKMNNIGVDGKTDLSSFVRVNANKEEVLKYKLEKGDFLFNSRNSKELVGKSTVFIGNPDSQPFLYNNNIIRVKFGKDIYALFINYWFASPEAFAIKQSIVTATTNVAALYQSQLMSFIVPLPPLAEQEAIVARVEELFKNIEALQEKTAQRIKLKKQLGTAALQNLTTAAPEDLPQNWQFLKENFGTIFSEAANVKKLRETILQLAVQGKLTQAWRHQNPNPEPASELLKRIQAEKAQLVKEKKIKKEQPLEPVDENEVPYELPESWVWCRLQDVGILDRGKSKHRPRNDIRLFKDGKYPLIQTGDVSASKFTNGFIQTHRTEYNEFGLAQSRLWPKGTLCITIAANIAETGFLGYEACFPDSVVGFKSILEGFFANYIKFFIDTSKNHLLEYAPSTAQKNINLGILNSMLFPLPPIAEQEAIVTRANQFIQLCDELEEQIEQSKQETEALMQAVVREALQVKEEVEL